MFSGTLVHSTSENMMDVCQNKIIGVDDDGKVTKSGHFSKRFDFLLQPFDILLYAIFFCLFKLIHSIYIS